MHLANIGTDNDIGIFCQVPNFNVMTIDPAAGYEDYMNYVYIGRYENDMESLSVDGGGEKEIIPAQFVLQQNYPNPFNPVTTIHYDLSYSALVSIDIYDMNGELVAELLKDYQSAGHHFIHWNGTNNHGQLVSAGIYLYSINAAGLFETRKMTLLK